MQLNVGADTVVIALLFYCASNLVRLKVVTEILFKLVVTPMCLGLPSAGYGPKCRTVYETHYKTIYETTYEPKCSTSYEKACETAYETSYETDYKEKCYTAYQSVCEKTYRQVHRLGMGTLGSLGCLSQPSL